jgi:two-component system phosphate regulon sensor histidine kinase PhoR
MQKPVKRMNSILMICSIMLVVAFQCYWIARLYNDELQSLKKETDVVFKDVVYKLQLQRFRLDTTFFGKHVPDNLFLMDVIDSARQIFIDSGNADNAAHKNVIISIKKNDHRVTADSNMHFITNETDSFDLPFPPSGTQGKIIRYLYTNKTLNDSLPVYTIDSAYKIELAKNNITLPFTVQVFTGNKIRADSNHLLQTSLTFTGLKQNSAYLATFQNPVGYIVEKIKWQIIFSFLLVFITLASFIFLYRNLVNQRKLAIIKDEFISNITHELKTPIATVSVAIEALKKFNAIDDPARTKEYLDISSGELQRLSMLVDKVLRLSMFENKRIELKKEEFDLYALAEEIIAIMKLQFEKAHAMVSLHKQGERFIIHADKIHVTSMLYNLLDNALKYSHPSPVIDVHIISHKTFIEITVTDDGIGIAPEYQYKIFEKFFRIPSDAHHETKGYGLGLSYVNHIARMHMGFVEVKSEQGKGSTFSVKLPYEEADEIVYDKNRRIKKENG